MQLLDTAKNLAPSPAAGVAHRLSLESHRLLRRNKATSVPMCLRNALADDLRTIASTLYVAVETVPKVTTPPPSYQAAPLTTATQCPTSHPDTQMGVTDSEAPPATRSTTSDGAPSLPTSSMNEFPPFISDANDAAVFSSANLAALASA